MNVSDRRLHVQLTQEAEIASDFLFDQGNFCVCGLCQRSDAARPCAVPHFLERIHTARRSSPAMFWNQEESRRKRLPLRRRFQDFLLNILQDSCGKSPCLAPLPPFKISFT